jgi:predicted NAD-dependent protein-ADP-ribosyltransferase YbiA (DUF1768 family)
MKSVTGGTVIFSVGLLIAAFSTCVSAQKCLTYGPAPVTLTGTLHTRVYAGPPNWESIRRGDRKETALILKLDNTTCTTGNDPMGLDVSHANLREMQLLIQNEADWKVVRNRMGKRVVLTGTLFGGHTGWHRTKVLIDVAHIRAVRSALTLPIAYPAVWFAPINDPNKPAWEILPQEAKPGEVILSKRNELGILSNFAATPFVLDGKRYASVEGFWQMMLYPEGPEDERAKDQRVTWKYTREQVAQMTAFEAKSAGSLAEENMKTVGIDWVTYNGKKFPYRSATPGEHYRLIVAAMRAKLAQNPEVRRILLATGDLILKPDHHGDENPPPEWKYYEIWMQLRSERRQQTIDR